MIKLLYVVSTLEYSGAARKVTTLAKGLPRAQFEVRVAVLGSSAPWVDTLRQGGIPVDLLGWNRSLDVRPLLSLRGVFRSFQPQVVHAWSPSALRTLAITGSSPATRVFVSDLLKPGHPLAFWDRWLLRNGAGVVAYSQAEAERYRRNGLASSRIAIIPPGIDPGRNEAAAPGVAPSLPTGRILLGIGPLEMHKGFRDAVWALDILHYLYADLHLVLAGDGSDRVRFAHFARSVGAEAWVHFAGRVENLLPLLQRVAVVWVPTRNQGGAFAALEAMAAARPVVATWTGGLDEIILDGVTGFLVKPGDKAGLARQTRLLLDDPALAARFGEAGRKRVLEHFTAARMVQQCERLYAGIGEFDPRNPGVTS